MIATNHALTGATIALVLHGSWLVLPLAFVSHFMLDAIPHYTPAADQLTILRSTSFRVLLVVDFIVCVALVGALAIFQPSHWSMAALAAFLATSPDLLWIKKFWTANKSNKLVDNHSLFLRFHMAIQWFTRPIGAAVEAVWFVAMGAALFTFFR